MAWIKVIPLLNMYQIYNGPRNILNHFLFYKQISINLAYSNLKLSNKHYTNKQGMVSDSIFIHVYEQLYTHPFPTNYKSIIIPIIITKQACDRIKSVNSFPFLQYLCYLLVHKAIDPFLHLHEFPSLHFTNNIKFHLHSIP